jgi:hypothetical protein
MPEIMNAVFHESFPPNFFLDPEEGRLHPAIHNWVIVGDDEKCGRPAARISLIPKSFVFRERPQRTGIDGNEPGFLELPLDNSEDTFFKVDVIAK